MVQDTMMLSEEQQQDAGDRGRFLTSWPFILPRRLLSTYYLGALAVVGRRIFSSYLLIVLAAMVMFGKIESPYFLTHRNILNVLTFSAVISVMAVGQFLVIVIGGIDLSVGSIAALTTVIAAVMLQSGHGAGVAILVALLGAAACGVANGFAVVFLRITPLVVTLAMMNIAVGTAYLVQSGSLISISNNTFIQLFDGDVGSLPVPIVFFVAVTLVFAFVMRSTKLGRHLYAIGGNATAARLSGLPVTRTIFTAYVLCATLAGIAGLILAAQLTQGSSLLAGTYNLDSIAAVVVGGASLFGGTGNPVAAVIGGLIIATLANIMNLMGIQSEPQFVVKGAVLLVAVFFITGDGRRLLRSAGSRLGNPAARLVANRRRIEPRVPLGGGRRGEGEERLLDSTEERGGRGGASQ